MADDLPADHGIENREELVKEEMHGSIEDSPIIATLEQEDPKLFQEYTAWKALAGTLYNRILGSHLSYPSLTVKWLPETAEDEDAITYQVLLGQNTSGAEQNHLILATIKFFKEPEENSKELSFDIVKAINHPGCVNRCAYSHKATHLVTTMTETGDALLFNLRMHPEETPDGELNAQATLKHHSGEGYAVEWSPAVAGSLATGANDAVVCLWDAEAAGKRDAEGVSKLTPTRTLGGKTGHTGGVQDLSWSWTDPHLLASCGIDKKLLVWDTRSNSVAHRRENAHGTDVNSIAMARKTANSVATGCDEGLIKIWDLRKLQTPVCTLEGHTGAVLSIAWCPADEDRLATSSADSNVCLWSLDEQECVFEHTGHIGTVAEVAWCEDDQQEDVILVSVSECDNMLHVWEPSDEALEEPSDDDN